LEHEQVVILPGIVAVVEFIISLEEQRVAQVINISKRITVGVNPV
jgi:hypothetical protein